MGIAFEDDRISSLSDDSLPDHSLKKLRKFAEYFADLSMKSREMLGTRPSIVAVSCIVCARMVTKIFPVWNMRLEEISNYNFQRDGIKACFEKLYGLYDETF